MIDKIFKSIVIFYFVLNVITTITLNHLYSANQLMALLFIFPLIVIYFLLKDKMFSYIIVIIWYAITFLYSFVNYFGNGPIYLVIFDQIMILGVIIMGLKLLSDKFMLYQKALYKVKSYFKS